MLYEPLLAHQISKEHMKDNLREAKRAQLVRVSEAPKKSLSWRLAIASVFSSLLALFTRS
jgi:hypothetical protein